MKLGLETAATERAREAGKARLLTRQALDGRTRARKTFDRIANGIVSDLGGRQALTTVEVLSLKPSQARLFTFTISMPVCC